MNSSPSAFDEIRGVDDLNDVHHNEVNKAAGRPAGATSQSAGGHSAARVLWSAGMALQLLAATAAVIGGIAMVAADAQDTDDWLHGLGYLIGGVLIAAGLVTAFFGTLGLFLLKRDTVAAAVFGMVAPVLIAALAFLGSFESSFFALVPVTVIAAWGAVSVAMVSSLKTTETAACAAVSSARSEGLEPPTF